jgi:RIO kinase 1
MGPRTIMSSDLAVERSLSPFFANKSISRVLRRLSSGKEAVVYCCEAGPALEGRELVAAKIYRPPERRAFRRHMEYADGRHVQGRTARAALKARNGYGQRLLFESWIQFEEQSLRRLHRRGVRVPESLGCQGYAILMEYLGDREAPAPLLHDVRLERSKAEWVLGRAAL